MPEHIHYEDDDLFNPETHHEHSDVPIRPLLWFIAIFVVFGFVTHGIIWFMYKGFASMETKRQEEAQTMVQRPASERVPQAPLLQPFPRQDEKGTVLPPNRNTPVTDLDDMREAEHLALQSYGWVDKEKGIVRIPIDVAKTLVAQRGLPAATTTAPAPVAPLPATATATSTATAGAAGAQ